MSILILVVLFWVALLLAIPGMSYLVGFKFSKFTKSKRIIYYLISFIVTAFGLVYVLWGYENCRNSGGGLGCLWFPVSIIGIPLITLPGPLLCFLLSIKRLKKQAAYILAFAPVAFIFIYFLFGGTIYSLTGV